MTYSTAFSKKRK